MVKRPWGHDQLVEHFRDIKLGTRLTSTPKRILDVGFGRLRRSTRALRAVFPEAEITAIDNDLTLFEGPEWEDGPGDARTRFLFSDVDLLGIPGLAKDKYDLVVFCMSLFCLPNPLRAIGTIARHALRKGGLLVITQRDDGVMRALCDLPVPEGSPAGEGRSDVEHHIREFWQLIYKAADAHQFNLEIPWRFRLVCRHDPIIAFLCDHGFKDLTADLDRRNPHKYKTFSKPENVELLSDLFGRHDKEPQYSKLKWVWKAFRKRGIPWPQPDSNVAVLPLNLKKIILRSGIFQFGESDGIHGVPQREDSEHPFSSYTAPLKILPSQWDCDRQALKENATKRVGEWISNLREPIRGFYLLSPHGVADEKPEPAALKLYSDRVEELDEIQTSDELALSKYLERLGSPSAMIQFYRVNSARHWTEEAKGSEFLEQGAEPVKMLAFPLFVSDSKDRDIEEILARLVVLELQLGVANRAEEASRWQVARYLRARGAWTLKNKAVAIYYYYRRNPPIDNKPVSRGASILTDGPLSIEATLEFLVMSEEVIGNFHTHRYLRLLEQRAEFSEKAGKAGVLVRNLSHHMGSHVLVHRQQKALDLAEEAHSISDGKASSQIDGLKSDSVFYTFLRERMEFLAMLSLDALRWSMPVTLRDLLSFWGNEKSTIIRENIGASEEIVFAPFDGELLGSALAQRIISLPWGTTGFQAFNTFVEGVLRNACKHGSIPRRYEAALDIQFEEDEKLGGIWLYCGVPGQTIGARETADAILSRILPGVRTDSLTGENPISLLNIALEAQRERGRLRITTFDGRFAHGALGVMELAVAAEFLSDGEAGLRVKEIGGTLYLGFFLAPPRGMYAPSIDASGRLPNGFRYKWSSYVVEVPAVPADRGFPPMPLGPRTLYVTHSKLDDRYAQVSPDLWVQLERDEESVARIILESRHGVPGFYVVFFGPTGWNSKAFGSKVLFFDEKDEGETLKAWFTGNHVPGATKILIIAHRPSKVPDAVVALPGVRVLGTGGGSSLAYRLIFGLLENGKLDSLRLLMYEAGFMKYEIYDDRLRGAHKESHAVALFAERELLSLKDLAYVRDVVRIIHVTPWDRMFAGENDLWKRYYPNIVFLTARGGEVRAADEGWGAPRVDYSSIENVLACVNDLDILVGLALLTGRIGCMPGRRVEANAG